MSAEALWKRRKKCKSIRWLLTLGKQRTLFIIVGKIIKQHTTERRGTIGWVARKTLTRGKCSPRLFMLPDDSNYEKYLCCFPCPSAVLTPLVFDEVPLNCLFRLIAYNSNFSIVRESWEFDFGDIKTCRLVWSQENIFQGFRDLFVSLQKFFFSFFGLKSAHSFVNYRAMVSAFIFSTKRCDKRSSRTRTRKTSSIWE